MLVALLLVGLAVAVPLLNSGDHNGNGGQQAGAARSAASQAPPAGPSDAPSAASTSAAPTSAAPSPSASASPSAAAGTLPAGWRYYRGPNGFQVPLPDGWRSTAGRNSVTFSDPGSLRRLYVQWTDSPKPDAVADWKSQESSRKNYVSNYQYLSITRCDAYRTCADWDWLQTRDGTRIHVRNRGIATASNRGYALRWEVPANDWNANLANFDVIAKGFKPDRVN
ncbi:hypothetical protein [Micromonospora sp. ATA51]|uniref:hypothetical protein n=1 Tax=Micromonospora sp. ATA51 TaxID=2806098 RepID=UPI001A60B199|nr:hypothetical protein [Micromonospora sp. ATA51]MBM0227709.1 hypothetical protein [Micromonospora sp. ATA51]